MPVCGVSMRLPSKDHHAVNDIAFATTTDVFYAKFAHTEKNLLHGKKNLARVLDGSHCVLAGFGMPRIALHLHRSCGLHMEGVELSALFDKKILTAAEFASKQIPKGVNKRKIHALAYGNDIEDVCLRAWLSAVCVHFPPVPFTTQLTSSILDSLATGAIKEVRCARTIDTRNLPDPHLACLSQLILNVELLEGERPSKAEGEIEGVEVGVDGQLVIQNARFNTRVRRSKQVISYHHVIVLAAVFSV